MEKGKFLRRASYAATRVLITRSDAGKTQFNYSEFLGNSMATVISNAYHPRPRTVGSNINVCVTQIGLDAIRDEFKEFWLDIRHLPLHHSHST